MRVPEAPDRRFLVAADMEKYSRQDNLSQWAAQQTFQEVMRRAVRTLGLNRVDWTTQQGGDGAAAMVEAR